MLLELLVLPVGLTMGVLVDGRSLVVLLVVELVVVELDVLSDNSFVVAMVLTGSVKTSTGM